MVKISIIIPIYNVEQYLKKCLESILAQTLDDIEVILVNDGSTDKSLDICNQYKLKDPRIKVIDKKNGGLSDARNKGIQIAEGEYIAFLDSDDWVEPNFYKYLWELAQKEKADIAQCDYIEAYHDETIISFKTPIKECTYTGTESLHLLYGNEYVRTVIACSKIYKRSLFEEIQFPIGKIHEDEFTTYKLLHKAGRVTDSNIKMYYYRQRENSITNEGFNEKRLHALEALKERIEYFNQYSLNELSQKTESRLCGMLKEFYIKAYKTDIVNKDKILKSIINDMRKYYIRFIKNPYITSRGKTTTTLCILNGRIFYKFYNKYISNT